MPHPAVTSTVLKIRRRKEPAVKVADRELFFRLVKMGFGQRRKVFTNAMKSGGISMELGKKILERAGIDGGRRGETFSMEEYAALANAWDELVGMAGDELDGLWTLCHNQVSLCKLGGTVMTSSHTGWKSFFMF